MKRLLCVMFSVCAIAGACGGGSGGESSSDAPTYQPIGDQTLERQLTLDVTGAHTVHIDERVDMRFVTRVGKDEDDMTLSVASVTLKEPYDLGDNRKLNPEIGLVGSYTGDGRFTIPAGLGQAPTSGPTVPSPPSVGTAAVSVAQITLIDLNTKQETRFQYLLEACEVELEDGATTGRAECHSLISVDGSKVTLIMTWRA